MPTNDIWQLNVDAEVTGGAQGTNVHHFRQQGPDPQGGAGLSIITAYKQQVEASQLATMSTAAKIVGYRARRVWPNPSQQITTIEDKAGTFTDASSHSGNVAACCTWYGTNTVNVRTRIGRTYLMGIGLTGIIGGLIQAALTILLKTFIDKLLAIITDTNTNTDWKKVLFDAATQTITDLKDGSSRTSSRKIRSRTRGVGS